MNSLVAEVQEWNTPAIGAYLLWRFTIGYSENHKEAKSPVVVLHFIAVGILLSDQCSELISGCRPNIESFIRGFSEKKCTDVLAMLQELIRDKIFYTLSAIDIAVALGYLAWNSETAEIYAINFPKIQKRGSAKLSPSIKKLGDKAMILGRWFSEKTTDSLISMLGVKL